MPNYYFGKYYDAPIYAEGTQVETPIGMICYNCDKPIDDGEDGWLRAVLTIEKENDEKERHNKGDNWNATLMAIHRECDIRSIVGYLDKYQKQLVLGVDSGNACDV